MTMRITRPTAIAMPRQTWAAATAWWLTLGVALVTLLSTCTPAAGTSEPVLTAPQGEPAVPATNDDENQEDAPLSERLPGPPLPELNEQPEEPGEAVGPPLPLALRDDIWLIDTRSPAIGPQFYRYENGGRFAASLGDLLAASEDGLPLCVWIHGYQVTPDFAEQMGLAVYEQLRRANRCGPHFRFVIWSWPSEKCGPYRVDAPRKARQSDVEGYKLAQVIQQLPPRVPVSLLGFSFGARTTGATLHFLGGGRIANMALSDSDPAARPVRAVLLAGALNHDAFSSCGLNSHAPQAANRVYVLVNRRDPVLIAYRHLESFRGQKAMGHTGPVGICSSKDRSLFRICDVSVNVGFSHCWTRYIYSPEIMRTITPMVLFADWFKPPQQESEEPLASVAAE